MTPNERAALLALVRYAMARGHTDACRLARAEMSYRHSCNCGFGDLEDATYDLRMEDDYSA